ncbi:MAG: riboflavin synthase [Hyphomicrobium sp.]|nr:MAG: riboflavin synthase [Hyphomicrobium sp.]
MFTGLIVDIGSVQSIVGCVFTIKTGLPAATIEPGASIACDGVCLTVTSITMDGHGSVFTVDVSNETRSKSTLGNWKAGERINLELALAAGDRLGGHVVTGHVDGIAAIIDVKPDGSSQRFLFDVPEHLARFIAPKGSVALDGTSLTVNEVMGTRFGVNLIPHTLTATTWGSKKPGDHINLEVDLFARYVARLLEFRP